MFDLKDKYLKIGVIGLGYVGLPLAVSLSQNFEVVGYDINGERINELRSGLDSTNEISGIELQQASNLSYSECITELSDCNFYIITVPTPVTKENLPDFDPIKKASELVAKLICRDDIIVYESTVYPGATRDICVPILEKFSGLKMTIDFGVGYSPERINPGDKIHTINNIIKLVSADSKNSLKTIRQVYEQIITAGVYETSSIEIAEAAKVIENTQRDLNIAFMNDLAVLFDKLGIDTNEVLDAAATKWNFLNFRPGLVGGHCIGVDPYYLTFKANQVGHDPSFILSGRRINEGIPKHLAIKVCRELIHSDLLKRSSKILILGYTFKEDCPDIRNTKVAVLVSELQDLVSPLMCLTHL